MAEETIQSTFGNCSAHYIINLKNLEQYCENRSFNIEWI